MKRILTLCAMLLMLVAGASCKRNNKSMNNQIDKQEKIGEFLHFRAILSVFATLTIK